MTWEIHQNLAPISFPLTLSTSDTVPQLHHLLSKIHISIHNAICFVLLIFVLWTSKSCLENRNTQLLFLQKLDINERLNMLTCFRLYTWSKWIAITIYFHSKTDNSPLQWNWNVDDAGDSNTGPYSNEGGR